MIVTRQHRPAFILLITVALLLALAPRAATARTVSSVRVVEVLSGDTVRITTGRLQNEDIVFDAGAYYYTTGEEADYELVRLQYCVAPETDEPGSEASRKFLEELVLQRTVEIAADDRRGTYGRRYVEMTLPEVETRMKRRLNVNREMLRTGWARYTDAQGSDPRMKDSATEGERNGAGLYQKKYAGSSRDANTSRADLDRRNTSAPAPAIGIGTTRSSLSAQPVSAPDEFDDEFDDPPATNSNTRSYRAVPPDPTPEDDAERRAKAEQIRIEIVSPTPRGTKRPATPRGQDARATISPATKRAPETLTINPSTKTTATTTSI